MQLLRQLADLSLPRASLHRRVNERWESGPIKTGRAQIVIAHGCQATGQQTTPPRRRQKRPRSSCSPRRPAAFKKGKTAACPSEETLMHTRGWRRDHDEAHDPNAVDAAQQRNPFVPQNTLHEEPELPSRSSRLSPDPRNHRAPHPLSPVASRHNVRTRLPEKRAVMSRSPNHYHHCDRANEPRQPIRQPKEGSNTNKIRMGASLCALVDDLPSGPDSRRRRENRRRW